MPGVPIGQSREIDLVAKKRVLLSNYCRLDFEGARLHPSGWSRFKPYTSLRDNPDYTRIVIVTRFDIETPQENDAVLNATYRTVGYYDETEGYSPGAASEKVSFRIQEQGGDPVLSGIDLDTPHVSPRAAIVWMNLRLADPKTSELERAHLKDAIAELNILVQPRPKAATP